MDGENGQVNIVVLAFVVYRAEPAIGAKVSWCKVNRRSLLVLEVKRLITEHLDIHRAITHAIGTQEFQRPSQAHGSAGIESVQHERTYLCIVLREGLLSWNTSPASRMKSTCIRNAQFEIRALSFSNFCTDLLLAPELEYLLESFKAIPTANRVLLLVTEVVVGRDQDGQDVGALVSHGCRI